MTPDALLPGCGAITRSATNSDLSTTEADYSTSKPPATPSSRPRVAQTLIDRSARAVITVRGLLPANCASGWQPRGDRPAADPAARRRAPSSGGFDHAVARGATHCAADLGQTIRGPLPPAPRPANRCCHLPRPLAPAERDSENPVEQHRQPTIRRLQHAQPPDPHPRPPAPPRTHPRPATLANREQPSDTTLPVPAKPHHARTHPTGPHPPPDTYANSDHVLDSTITASTDSRLRGFSSTRPVQSWSPRPSRRSRRTRSTMHSTKTSTRSGASYTSPQRIWCTK